MKELHSESEDQDLEFTQDVTGSHIPDTEEVPVDTAKDPGSAGKTRRSGNRGSSPADSARYGRTGCIRKESRFRQNTPG